MIKLIQGDCLEKMSDIENGSVHMILADPPFGTTNCKWDSVIELKPMWSQIERIIKPNGIILLFSQLPFDKVLGASNLPLLRYEWIWEKPNATGFLNAKKMPLKAHENILVFYKKLPEFYPQKTKGHKRKTAGKKQILSKHYGESTQKTYYDSTERYPRDVLKMSSDKQKFRGLNPCRKPLKLLRYLIEPYTLEGQLVVDFCMGSGATGEAAVGLKRNFIGIDKDKTEFKTATNRINTAAAQISF